MAGSGRASRPPGRRARVRVRGPGTGQDGNARRGLSHALPWLDCVQHRCVCRTPASSRRGACQRAGGAAQAPDAGYWLLECLPTSTWRTSGLKPLPGKRNTPPEDVEAFAWWLAAAYQLPAGALTRNHDDLQALVATLPGVALLGGPAKACPRGEAAPQGGFARRGIHLGCRACEGRDRIAVARAFGPGV